MSMADTVLYDDDYQIDSSEYVNPGQEILPLPGNYRFRVTSFGRKAFNGVATEDKDANGGEPWPRVQLNRVEIVEPFEEGGQFSAFQEVRTRPTTRKGPGGKPSLASQHVDLLNAIDATAADGLTFREAIGELEQRLAAGSEFVAGTGLKATDSAWAQEQIEQLKRTGGDTQEAINDVWNKARLGTKDFKNPDGSYSMQKTHPVSGNLLTAKLTLGPYRPATDSVVLGPYKQKNKAN